MRIFESNLHSGASTLIHADGDIMTGLRLLDDPATAVDHLGEPARARIAAKQAQAYAACACATKPKPPSRASSWQQALDDDGDNTNVVLAARVDLASAYALTGHLDRACTTLGDAYEQLQRIGNLRGISRARRAREGLNRWNTERAVRELDYRMSAA